ncbi:hypothetical protein PK28_02710 [Hymenobacter sp. DG25B]|uniref:hypothetical protein n=1 Tax=Hymenobacter sp. DG25B TaxID=1385664 RepID=UPI0005409488|nr:hypothetical protein [Hymenobacter sp. DG25B]AIZ62867.1 hypothetical protein PK28_02710 [Hymenobacter sp. DG25B]
MQWTPFSLFASEPGVSSSATIKARPLPRAKRPAAVARPVVPPQQLAIPFQQTLPAFSTMPAGRLGVTFTRADIFQIGEFIIGRTECQNLYGHPDIRY